MRKYVFSVHVILVVLGPCLVGSILDYNLNYLTLSKHFIMNIEESSEDHGVCSTIAAKTSEELMIKQTLRKA